MTGKHLSSQYDSDLNGVSSQLMEMGGLVEAQVKRAIHSLAKFSISEIDDVLATEARIDRMEIEIDRELAAVIVRRQPAARDLRLLLAISKVTSELERAGDEAHKIGKRVRSLVESGETRQIPIGDLRVAADLAGNLIHRALDAFARLDVAAAIEIYKEDDQIDREFKGFTRKLVVYMLEDPRIISSSLDLLFIAKGIERIGDHAKNISEYIIYVVHGTDVRHSKLKGIENIVQ
jgi:phosphate transport system protein